MQTIIGQLSKISSTADQMFRLTVDVPFESAPDKLKDWMYQMVKIELVEVKHDNR